MSTRTVSVRLLAEISGWISPMKAATQSVKDFRTELAKAAGEGKLDSVASTATRAGLALEAGFLLAVGAAARFEKAMSQVGAVANASESDLQALSDAALQAGKDTSFSATEAAQAEEELAKAGLSASDILGGALTGSLDLAAAGSLDLAEAADVAAKAMNVFDLTGQDVAHVADVLASAANTSATDVHELGAALKMGGLAAKNAGLTLEDTVGTLAAFADNALVGSDAGTSFKTMLQMLAAPSSEAVSRMKQLGIAAYDAQGQFVGVARLAGILQDKLGDLTQEQRNEALATIFGADAMRAATILYNEGERGIRRYIAGVNDQGAAAEAAAKKTDNLMGDIERLTGSLETLFIQSGSGANSGLRMLVQGLGELVDIVASIPAPVLSFGTILVGIAGTGLLVFGAMVKVRSTIRDTINEMRNAGPVAGRFATGLERTHRWATRAAIAMGTLKIAAVALDALTNRQADVEGLNDALKHLGDNNERTGEIVRLFGDDLSGFAADTALAEGKVNAVAGAIEAFLPGARQLNELINDHSFSGAAENIKAVDDALTTMVREGNLDQARGAYIRLLQASKMSATELSELLPQYTNAITEAERQTGRQAAQAKVAADMNKQLAGAFGEAASEAEGLIKAFDELNGEVLSWREAEREAEAAVDDLQEALRESNGSLDIHNEKGRTAAAAVDALARKAAEAAQRKMDETHSVQEANAVYQRYIDQLRIVLAQAGYTKVEIDKLVGAIAAMPSTKTVTITANVSISGTSQLTRVLKELDRLGAMRYGGIRHAQVGLLSQASTFRAGSAPLYAFAEPGTGGEAFVPRNGNYDRSMSILGQAAGWYNAAVVPRGWYAGMAGRAGSMQVEVIVSPAPGSDAKVMDAITEGLRFDVRTRSGGNVQTHLGPRGRR